MPYLNSRVEDSMSFGISFTIMAFAVSETPIYQTEITQVPLLIIICSGPEESGFSKKSNKMNYR